MLKFSLTLAACAGLVASAAAAKDPISVTGRDGVRVSYADLNLGSAAGRERLEGRVRRAAQKLCIDHRVDDLGRAMAGRACLTQAIASARPQIEQAFAETGDTQLASARNIDIQLRR